MQDFPTEPRFLNLEWLFMRVYNFFVRIFGSDAVSFVRALELFKLILTLLVIITLVILIFLLVRMHELQQEDKPKKEKKTKTKEGAESVAVSAGAAAGTVALVQKNETWERIRQNAYSEEESRWRLAIIEADIYMDKLLDQRGYVGETVSDKLKQLSENQLASIQYAWEAHKVRNKIAHEGADFVLTLPETRRIILLYEVVFRELNAL